MNFRKYPGHFENTLYLLAYLWAKLVKKKKKLKNTGTLLSGYSMKLKRKKNYYIFVDNLFAQHNYH